MENYIFIINTVAAFLIALLWDILQRDKASRHSPKRFDLGFFLSDNKIRLILSFCLSLLIMLIIWANVIDANLLFGSEYPLANKLIYVVVGAAPDLVISYAKRKVGFLQPDEAKGFKRK